MLLNTLPSIDPTIFAALIGILGTLVGAILPLIAARLRQRKRISYTIVADTPILLSPGAEGGVRVTFDQREVHDARLLVIRVRNSGNTAILAEDYELPIAFEFEGKVLQGDITSTSGKTLTTKDVEALRISDAHLVILPRIHLNPKDAIIISVLLAGPPGHIKMKGRIIDGQIAAQGKG
jgi:hypothetical protein